MRLLIQLDDQKQCAALSAYLLKKGIENKLEIVPESDWGNQNYGNTISRIWVIDEDHFDEARVITNEFMANPKDSRFVSVLPSPRIPSQKKTKKQPKATVNKLEPFGKITLFFIAICALFLFLGELTTPDIQKAPAADLPLTPLLMPPLYKELLFDYPKAYEIIDKLVLAYGINSLDTPETLPAGGKFLLEQYHQTPYWTGYYDILIHNRQHPNETTAPVPPLFEKEQQGEFWRLFTPCLLHADILHLLFNMLWVAVLGKQMEFKLGKGRYLFFILAVGIGSNLAQYFMSGSNFLGFSGIICGMLAFIWVRRRKAAWEGYQLQPGTIGFIGFFILLMFAIQLVSFISEYFYAYHLPLSIANTAHLAGACLGYLLGNLKFFAWKMN